VKTIYLTEQFKFKGRSAAAVGIFDGMHRGHQYLLRAMLRKAKTLKARSMAVTFFPHPAHLLRPDIRLGYLVSFAHRLRLLEGAGVQVCVVIPFTRRFASIEPQAFIRDVLVKRLGARAIFTGEDFRFGRNRAGDVGLFKQLAPVHGYQMHAVPALTSGGHPVSSTRIRGLITAGELTAAKQLLGRPFAVLGEVIRGKNRGKRLGFPTANVRYDNDILPPQGVYAVRVIWKDKTFKGAANLGLRPSFKEKRPKVQLEVYIFNFKGNLYGQAIEVEFIKQIRDEQRFATPMELAAQIKKDVASAKKILS